MKPGDIVRWLDQGPAILLNECEIPDPCSNEEYQDYLKNPEAWPSSAGWRIKLVLTEEILDVHPETLDTDFGYN